MVVSLNVCGNNVREKGATARPHAHARGLGMRVRVSFLFVCLFVFVVLSTGPLDLCESDLATLAMVVAMRRGLWGGNTVGSNCSSSALSLVTHSIFSARRRRQV